MKDKSIEPSKEECNMFGCTNQTDIVCDQCNRHYCDECFDEHFMGSHA